MVGSREDQTLILGNGVIVTNKSAYPKNESLLATQAFARGVGLLLKHLFQKGFDINDPLIKATVLF